MVIPNKNYINTNNNIDNLRQHYFNNKILKKHLRVNSAININEMTNNHNEISNQLLINNNKNFPYKLNNSNSYYMNINLNQSKYNLNLNSGNRKMQNNSYQKNNLYNNRNVGNYSLYNIKNIFPLKNSNYNINGNNYNNNKLNYNNNIHPQAYLFKNNIMHNKTYIPNMNNKIIKPSINNIQLKNMSLNNNNNKTTLQIKPNNNNNYLFKDVSHPNNLVNTNTNIKSFPLVPNNIINNNLTVNSGGGGNVNNEGITLFFYFSNGKELYIDVKESDSFSEVIKQLIDKYVWLKDIKILNYQFNGAIIDLAKTVKEIGLKDNSQINIIEM